MSEQQGWRKVSEWGQPTAETCPHGYRWRHGETTGVAPVVYLPLPSVGHQWQPLPPPVDEVLPPPEPEARWKSSGGSIWPLGLASLTEVDDAAATLNAIEAGETVGRVRPWQEAPDDKTAVLAWDGGAWWWSNGRQVRSTRYPWVAQPAPPKGEAGERSEPATAGDQREQGVKG